MKKILMLLLPFLLLAAPGINADSLLDKKEEYTDQIQQIDNQLKNTDDKRKIIELNQKRNELKAYENAYMKAISYSNENTTPVMFLQTKEPPKEYINIYQEAAKNYGIDWTLLAAVHKVETNFSEHPTMTSSAGAIGHMQFMPGTWKLYGVDANGDGKADPWNIKDAIFSAAHYLSKTGAADGDIKNALFAYNRSTVYGKNVLSYAESYKEAFKNKNVPVVEVGKKFIGNSTYVFGGGRTKEDIKNHIFDCSSFVHWSFAQNGVELGDLTGVTTDTIKKMGKAVKMANIKPGDLVFFDTYKKDGHVGIYAGNGKFIGAQESTGVAVADMTQGYWNDKFNGKIRRIQEVQ